MKRVGESINKFRVRYRPGPSDEFIGPFPSAFKADGSFTHLDIPHGLERREDEHEPKTQDDDINKPRIEQLPARRR